MALVDLDLAERMLDVVRSIPPGTVMSYGQVAAAAGSVSARLAGRVMAELSDDTVPWYRVVRADGSFAPHIAARQAALLRSEGVEVRGSRVDMAVYRARE